MRASVAPVDCPADVADSAIGAPPPAEPAGPSGDDDDDARPADDARPDGCQFGPAPIGFGDMTMRWG